MKSTSHEKSQTKTRLNQEQASAGPTGLAMAPPASGVDFVDRGLGQAQAQPVPRAEAGVVQRVRDESQRKGATSAKAKNKTGLPDKLKAGVEHLSGLSLDDVKVHYNSPKPAHIQAAAYAQGTDIHLGPGQQKHLPHEAWHVVQQKQGRVQATLQLKGVAINDNAALEREADQMGRGAWQYHHRNSGDQVNQDPKNKPATASIIQRNQPSTALGNVIQKSSLTEKKSDGPFDSPFTILQRELPGVNLFLSSVNNTNTHDPSSVQTAYKRPREVEARIQGPRRPSGTRPPSGVPAAVGNLGDQELLIRNGIRQQTFQGGHLIGDELLPNTIDSMVDWNLAPQNSDFNHPVYFGLVEELIFAGAISSTTNQPDLTIPISVEVELDYPSNDFTVTVQDLINHGVVAAGDPNIKIPKTKSITFPNRIPHKWNIRATISGSSSANFSRHLLTTNQQSAFNTKNDLSTPLSRTDYLVSSPDLQNVHGTPTIGGGPQLRLFGMQGDSDPTNINPSRMGGPPPIISAPAFVPPPIFSSPYNINDDVNTNNGDLSPTAVSTLEGLVSGTKTTVKSMQSRIKKRYLQKYNDQIKSGKITKKRPVVSVFKDHDDFLAVMRGEIPNTKAGKQLRQCLTLDRSIQY